MTRRLCRLEPPLSLAVLAHEDTVPNERSE